MIGYMTERHTLYRVHDTNGVLLYVGATTDPGQRLRRHHLHQPWWDEAASITLQHFSTWEELMEAETRAIETEGAKHNVIHSPHAVRSTKPRSRRKGQGSVYRRGDGMWVGAVSMMAANGKRVRKTVSSKDRAVAELKFADLVAQARREDDEPT